jgi:hypothetical protein
MAKFIEGWIESGGVCFNPTHPRHPPREGAKEGNGIRPTSYVEDFRKDYAWADQFYCQSGAFVCQPFG